MVNKTLQRAFILSFLILAACNNDVEQKVVDQPENIVQPSDSITLTDDNVHFESWEDHYRVNDIHFALDSFQLYDTISSQLISTTADLSDSFFNKYGKLLVYNQDSSLFIDPFSYSLIVEKGDDGKLYAREGEADHEVAIVDPKTNTRKRLLFCGPSCQIQNVFWHNDNIVGIMGLSSEYADEYFTPKIWYVNIHNGITIPYEYHYNVSIIEAHEYLKKQIESKGLEMKH